MPQRSIPIVPKAPEGLKRVAGSLPLGAAVNIARKQLRAVLVFAAGKYAVYA